MSEELIVGSQGEINLSEEQCRRWGIEPGASVVVSETAEGLMVRPADPVLSRLYVEPTSLCNLTCRTCVRHSWEEPIGTMAMSTYGRLLAGARGVPSLKKISFWGFGEPLMHPQIVEMVAMAHRLKVKTELISNALLLDRRLAIDLVDVGLDTLVVSVDGASAESYADVRSGADLGLVKQNIAILQEVRNEAPRRNPEIGLEYVAMRSNLDQLPRLRNLAGEMGASFVIVTNVLPYTKELSDEILYPMSVGRTYVNNGNRFSPQVTLPTMDLRHGVMNSLPNLLESFEGPITRLGRLQNTTGYCRFVNEGAAAVSWDGEVSPCVALMHSYTCFVLGREKRIKRHIIGNVAVDDIAEIWRRDQARAFRSLVQSFDFAPCSSCGGCHLSETNEEDCYGNTFPVCGDCLWAQGVIQCP
jgi:MoaA/NifB/PqqE/SkfB family radical SAM enzyme